MIDIRWLIDDRYDEDPPRYRRPTRRQQHHIIHNIYTSPHSSSFLRIIINSTSSLIMPPMALLATVPAPCRPILNLYLYRMPKNTCMSEKSRLCARLPTLLATGLYLPSCWDVQLGDEMPARDTITQCRWCRRAGCRHHCHRVALSLP